MEHKLEKHRESKSVKEKAAHIENFKKGNLDSDNSRKSPQSSPNAFRIRKNTLSQKNVVSGSIPPDKFDKTQDKDKREEKTESSKPPPLPPKPARKEPSPPRPHTATTKKPDGHSNLNDDKSTSSLQDDNSDGTNSGSDKEIQGETNGPGEAGTHHTNVPKEVRQYDIDLLMIGKTGNGKSALGNSILGRDAFASRSSSTSVTKEVADEVTQINGRIIKVVDVPGVGDTDMNEEEAKKFVVENLSYAISINPRGYHAILLVIKYGERFTKENRVTIEVLKKVFGENFVSKYCLLVMTHGDLLGHGVIFEEWIKEEKGDLADLLKECGNRVVLFDNRTEDEDKKESQRNELLDIVHEIIFENCRYTNEQFNLAKSTRKVLIENTKTHEIEDKTMTEAGQILKELQSIQVNVDYKDNLIALQTLLARAQELHNELKCTDMSTVVLKDLLRHVESVQNTINDEIKLNTRISELIKNLDKKDQQRSIAFKKNMKRQKKTLRKGLAEDKKSKEKQDGKKKQITERKEKNNKDELKEEKEGNKLKADGEGKNTKPQSEVMTKGKEVVSDGKDS